MANNLTISDLMTLVCFAINQYLGISMFNNVIL